MRFKHLLALFTVLINLNLNTGCSSNDKTKDNSRSPELNPASSIGYDLDNPIVVKLPAQLNEISGIAFYPKDTSVFSIVDEDGVLYKIHLSGNLHVENWRFGKGHDFEDVVLLDSIFYILISNGAIERLKFNGNGITRQRTEFPESDKKTREFETLYYDDKKGFILICKQCDDDKKKAVSAYGYHPSTESFSRSVLSINVLPVDEQLGEQKIRLKPSAAAINPATNELYILCSVNKLLVIADRDGNFKKVFTLDSKIYKQPEGIAFTPAGDMIISNEYNEVGSANLLILKRKKN